MVHDFFYVYFRLRVLLSWFTDLCNSALHLHFCTNVCYFWLWMQLSRQRDKSTWDMVTLSFWSNFQFYIIFFAVAGKSTLIRVCSTQHILLYSPILRLFIEHWNVHSPLLVSVQLMAPQWIWVLTFPIFSKFYYDYYTCLIFPVNRLSFLLHIEEELFPATLVLLNYLKLHLVSKPLAWRYAWTWKRFWD